MHLHPHHLHVPHQHANPQHVTQTIANKILPLSTHNLHQLKQPIKHPPHYLPIPPLYPTQTKNHTPTLHPLSFITQLPPHPLQIPILPIPPITYHNPPPLIQPRPHALTIITAITHTPHPKKPAQNLKSLLEAEKAS
ncbi:thiamine phosphate synthase, partial [Bacillus sp. WP8]|uniref:thiamine phosphate synthase n=1 Tax=Bacillus sp. WP8 TaxID=756828 RepID=UPI0037BE64ED